jgi:phosphoserine phosphatase RsbU/P
MHTGATSSSSGTAAPHTTTSDGGVLVAPAHGVACMEIWGGNQIADTVLSTTGIDVHLHSTPHGGSESGGDVHYVSMCAGGRITRLVVADVAGHGEEVAGTARTLRGLVRKNINTLDQSRFARALNEAFGMNAASADDSGRFATALLASFNAPTDHLVLVNAGHPRPMIWRKRPGRWAVLDARRAAMDDTGLRVLATLDEMTDGPSDLPLGVIEPTSYTQFALRLEPGDLVLVTTDGVTESRSPAGEELGEAGLLRMLDGLRPEAATLLADLRAALAQFRGGAPANDDLTLALMHRRGGTRYRVNIGERLGMLARFLGIANAYRSTAEHATN